MLLGNDRLLSYFWVDFACDIENNTLDQQNILSLGYLVLFAAALSVPSTSRCPSAGGLCCVGPRPWVILVGSFSDPFRDT